MTVSRLGHIRQSLNDKTDCAACVASLVINGDDATANDSGNIIIAGVEGRMSQIGSV